MAGFLVLFQLMTKWPKFGKPRNCRGLAISQNKTQKQSIETLKPFFFTSKTGICPSLGYIHLLLFDFHSIFPSIAVVCCRCIIKIFFRREMSTNVYNFLHWNTWGKVSSPTLWLIPIPQREPQPLVACCWKLSEVEIMGNFPLCLESELEFLFFWSYRVLFSKNLQDPVWCFWTSSGKMINRCHFKFETFLWLRKPLSWERRGQQDSEGRRWLFTLHSDQSFLSTPELRDSKIGIRPVEKKKKASVTVLHLHQQESVQLFVGLGKFLTSVWTIAGLCVRSIFTVWKISTTPS